MRPLMLVGVLLIVGGVGALALDRIVYTEKEEVVDIGPLSIEREEERTIAIPTALGIIAIVAGAALCVTAQRVR